MTDGPTRTNKMARLDAEIRTCRKCRLHETRRNAVPGEGPVDAEIMICGQAPGRTEDTEGRPFIGMAGKFLDAMLRSIKLPRDQLFITSPVKCFPPNNRIPSPDEFEACRPYLEKQRSLINPQIIIALGNYAVRTLLDTKRRISQLHGNPQEHDGTIIFPTFHPAAATETLRVPGRK